MARKVPALTYSLLFLLMFFGSMNTHLALAHGEGPSLEKNVGNYIVDIGYEPEIIEAGSSVIFDFSLLSVRFENGDEILAETTFPLKVRPTLTGANTSKTNIPTGSLAGAVSGFIVGSVLVFFLKR